MYSPRLSQIKSVLTDYADANNKHLKEFCVEFKEEAEGAETLLEVAKDLHKQLTEFLEESPVMAYKPIAALDRTLELLYYQYGQRKQTGNRR